MSTEERIGVVEPSITTIPPEALQPALTAQPPTVVTPPTLPSRPAFDYTPTTLEGAYRMAEIMANSGLVPKDYRGNPDNCFLAMQWGHEIGLKPVQAVQNIAVVNGRPSLWGDAMLALVRNSPLCEYVREEFDADGTAICRVKRRGDVEQVRTFSEHDAQVAGLLGKDNTHRTYPKRMRQMRARAWALRDVFTDILRGIPMAEESMDTLPVVDAGPATLPPRVPQPKAKASANDDEEDRKAGKAPKAGDPIGAATRRTEPDDAAATTPASAGMLTMIRKRLQHAALSTADVVKRFPEVPEDLSGISVAQANAILAWTANPTES